MVTTKISKPELSNCYWLFRVFTVLGLCVIVAWLSLTPKNPHFRIINAHFPVRDSKNQSSRSNASIPVPNNSIIIDLHVFNPNTRIGIYYSVVHLELYRGDGVVVGANSTPGFYQGYKNNKTLQILINAGREVWRSVNNGDVGFSLKVETDVKFQIIQWKTKACRVVYGERFSIRTFSGGDYAEMQNATKVKIKI